MFSKKFLYNEIITLNKPINQIVREQNSCKETIRKYCHLYEIPTTKHKNHPFGITKTQLESLHFDEKLTLKEIADKIGCTRRTVLQHFQKNNIVGQDNRKHKNKKYWNKILTEDTLNKEYIQNNLTKIEIQKKYNIGQEVLDKLFDTFQIKLNKRYQSAGERDIVKFIKQHYDKKIIQNTRTIIPPNEIDIFLPDRKLAIEYNGIYWHSQYDAKYHSQKTDICNKQGITLFQIYCLEWTNKSHIWKSMILNKLGKSKKIYARKTKIIEIDTKTAKQFLEYNHLFGWSAAKIYLGAEQDGDIVAVMSLGKPRFNQKYEWELIRYCSQINTQVVGGAGKLLKYFEIKYQPKNIISYADRRYSTGELYNKLGFTQTGISEPGYYYIKNRVMFSREAFQKHKLNEKLPIFDPNKTEKQNMIENGYRILFNCGNLVFSK